MLKVMAEARIGLFKRLKKSLQSNLGYERVSALNTTKKSEDNPEISLA